VFRHNDIHNMNTDAHGFCAIHGTREWEISNNRWLNDTGNSLWAMMHMRGGTGVIYGNSLSGTSVSYGIYWNEYRISNSGNCGASDSMNVPGFGFVHASNPCATTEGYPCAQQIGRGQNNATDPVYVWNNTGLPQMGWDVGVAAYVQENRDYFMIGPKPGYTAYPYPHPLTLDGSATEISSLGLLNNGPAIFSLYDLRGRIVTRLQDSYHGDMEDFSRLEKNLANGVYFWAVRQAGAVHYIRRAVVK
jgi:hypothetical protein